jgi:hypothetical protein
MIATFQVAPHGLSLLSLSDESPLLESFVSLSSFESEAEAVDASSSDSLLSSSRSRSLYNLLLTSLMNQQTIMLALLVVLGVVLVAGLIAVPAIRL